MLKIKCLLCSMQTPPVETELVSQLVATTDKEALGNIVAVMDAHVSQAHPKVISDIAGTVNQWIVFNMVKYFVQLGGENELYEKEKEAMRDELATMIMFGTDDDELEIEDRDDNEVDFGDEEEEDETDDEDDDEEDEDDSDDDNDDDDDTDEDDEEFTDDDDLESEELETE